VSVKKKAVKRAAARPKASAAKRPPAGTTAARRGGSKPTAKPKANGTRLGLVPRAKRAAPPAPRSFPQTEGASGKQMIVFRLIKARARVLAALQGMIAGTAEQPLGEGKWNTREIVLHLCCRDRVRLREFESALRGVEVSWRNLDDRAMEKVNADHLQPISHLAWDEALRLLQSTRQSLMDAIEGVPEEPAEVWSPEHPFGWMLQGLPEHDQHHAEIIKKWRAEIGA
jgi:hypothetical protein